jgi:hypothetical protein
MIPFLQAINGKYWTWRAIYKQQAYLLSPVHLIYKSLILPYKQSTSNTNILLNTLVVTEHMIMQFDCSDMTASLYLCNL